MAKKSNMFAQVVAGMPDWVKITPVSLEFARIPELKEIEDFIPALRDLKALMPYAIGDLVNAGEANFGEDFSQVIDLFGDYEYHTVANYKSLCKRVAKDVRRVELSLSHHQLVAKLPEDEQVMWLERAVYDPKEGRKLTAKELDILINGEKKDAKKSFVERCTKEITELANIAEMAPDPQSRELIGMAISSVKEARDLVKADDEQPESFMTKARGMTKAAA